MRTIITALLAATVLGVKLDSQYVDIVAAWCNAYKDDAIF